MRASRAVLRGVSEALASYGVDVAVAREQHAAYEAALREAGVETILLPADPELADCCFIEDTAVIRGDRALITRMGFEARRPEAAVVRDALAALGYAIDEMQAPDTLEGGDVLRIGGRVYVGRSSRTNTTAGLGTAVPVGDCLHLKTACTAYASDTLVLNTAWVDPAHFAGFKIITATDPNVLLVNETRFVTDSSLDGKLLDISEFQKAEGGLTCLSLLLP